VFQTARRIASDRLEVETIFYVLDEDRSGEVSSLGGAFVAIEGAQRNHGKSPFLMENHHAINGTTHYFYGHFQ
jgi:hypothetical protein